MFRVMLILQKTHHRGMKGLCPVLFLTFLLATAYCDDSPSVNNSANFVKENDITDGKYDNETTNSTLYETTSDRNAFQTDVISELVNTVFTSPLIKNGKIKKAKEASTFSSNNAEYDNKAITYPMTRTAINVHDGVTFMYTSNSKQTRKLENEHTSMTPPTTKFLPNTPIAVDACDTDQVEVTKSPVLVNAFTNETSCSLLVTAPLDTSMSVKLLHSGSSNATTYFYVNRLGNLPKDCPSRNILVSVDLFPCITVIRGGQFRLYFQNTLITLEIHIVDIQMPQCSMTKINESENVQCKSTSFAAEIGKNIETYNYTYYTVLSDGHPSCLYHPIPRWEAHTLNTRVIHYLARCACDCPENCMCTLGFRKWLSMCIDSKDSKTTSTDLIVYNQTMSGLSFAYTGMDEVQQNALLGFQMLEVLILEHNSLAKLPASICQNLHQLKVLKLGHNILSNLASDIFKGQCGHELLGIYLNNNELTYLAPDLFNSTEKLSYLDLSQNRLTHTLKDTLKPLTELYSLYLTANLISFLNMLEGGVLRKMTRLRLSDNRISVLPVRVFVSLGALRVLYLSNNHILQLLVGVFDSLYCLNYLYLDGNHISIRYYQKVCLTHHFGCVFLT